MYIVTGGAGFIGSAFVSKLNREGITDIVVVDKLGTSEKWKNLVGKQFLDFVQKEKFLDLLDGPLLRKAKAIIHMGACSSTTETDGDYLLANNFAYTRSLATFAAEQGKRFIYASSAATYGDGSNGYEDDHESIRNLAPKNRYAFSKHLFDTWARDRGLLSKMAGLKFFNVYGPNEYHKGEQSSVVLKAYHHIKQTGSAKLFRSYRPDFGDGEQKRDFVYIRDCVDILWWFLENPEANGIYNVGSGRARSWNDLVNAIFEALKLRPAIEYVDMPESLKEHYQYFTQAPMEKLLAICPGLVLTSLEDGVKDYVLEYLEKDGRTY